MIACANVANLTLARATSRICEVAARAVLDAGRVRIVARLLSEILVLALAAGLLGVGIAAWGARSLLVVGRPFAPAPLLSGMYAVMNYVTTQRTAEFGIIFSPGLL